MAKKYFNIDETVDLMQQNKICHKHNLPLYFVSQDLWCVYFEYDPEAKDITALCAHTLDCSPSFFSRKKFKKYFKEFKFSTVCAAAHCKSGTITASTSAGL